MKSLLKGNVIYFVVFLIGILLLTDILLTKNNNKIIQQNKELQTETQQIKIYYDQIGKLIIHALDLGLRGYAIGRTEKLAKPMYNAVVWKDSILNNVEIPLKKQHYDLTEFQIFKDSLTSYFNYCFYLKKLLDEGKEEEFYLSFKTDKGGALWGRYIENEKNINKFENKINAEAEKRYFEALNRNQLLQIVIFLICFPTLLITANNSIKTFKLSELLRMAEEDNNRILVHKKLELEEMVAERTREIITQNEEISSQSDELSAQRDVLAKQNAQLHEAQKLIEEQNREIQSKNEQLEQDVKNRTQELEYANQQLIDHNNQLEQFSFITAHNLRAPLARILGLANVMDLAESVEEKQRLMNLLVSSTRDLDEVIKDLNTILDIKKHTGNYIKVDLPVVFERVMKILEKECEETHAQVIGNFEKVSKINAVAPYVESILYNLISNAIKYRSPERPPIISVTTTLDKDFVCLAVADNGLGIDLNTHKQKIFNLYKRFHLHMEGKGLGLYLVKTQIMALGGNIDIESEIDKGTTFKVYFKL